MRNLRKRAEETLDDVSGASKKFTETSELAALAFLTLAAGTLLALCIACAALIRATE